MDTDAQLKPAFRFADLEDRAVLVTGGGSGIGAGVVEAFARQGARVVFFDIAEADSRALEASLADRSVRHRWRTATRRSWT